MATIEQDALAWQGPMANRVHLLLLVSKSLRLSPMRGCSSLWNGPRCLAMAPCLTRHVACDQNAELESGTLRVRSRYRRSRAQAYPESECCPASVVASRARRQGPPAQATPLNKRTRSHARDTDTGHAKKSGRCTGSRGTASSDGSISEPRQESGEFWHHDASDQAGAGKT